MTDDSTLGGYLKLHSRPPAFEGSDGIPYSVDMYIADAPNADGRLGGAVLFVRWSDAGDAPIGHLETDYIVYGGTATEVQDGLQALTLHDLKAHLDRLIAEQKEQADW